MVSTAPTKQTAHILPQNSQNPQKPLAEISSHRWHRCAQILLTEIFSHGLHRTHRILAPSMCNYRRVWHPCHTHADTKLSSHRSLRSQTICVHLCHLWENYQVGGVGMAGCHTLLSVFCGRTRTLNFCGFRAFCGRIHTPWGENTKRAWRNAMPSYVSYVDAWVWQGCHTLL